MEGGLVLCLVICMQMVVVAVVGVSRPPAMYVFGDSLLDVGNNNYLWGPRVNRANRPYYGIDYPFRIPTGRFSNGYNTADYVAMSMGFVASPPAYLSLPPSLVAVTAIRSGVSYASGGAGILDNTNAGSTIPLSLQVQYFYATKARMAATLGSVAANTLLSRCVFLIAVGNNDMFSFLAVQNSRSAAAADQQRDVAAFYTSLISNYSAAIVDLHAMGARRFAIINVGLVGCVPAVRVLNPAGACSDGLNQLAAGFNVALRSRLDELAAKLPGLRYSLADSYSLTAVTVDDATASGYADVAAACCGGGRLNAELECTPSSVLCRNRDQHVFWDRFHPTQLAAFRTAQAFYDGPAQYTTPINFMQLAQTTS